jgi:hypothetical protein
MYFYGPNGHITNTALLPSVPPGHQAGPFVWHNPNPNANMTPGDYCTEWVGDFSQADCVNVHS